MTTLLASRPTAPAAAVFEEFEVLLVSDDQEPGYSVFCLSMPGCISEGDDRAQNSSMAAAAGRWRTALAFLMLYYAESN